VYGLSVMKIMLLCRTSVQIMTAAVVKSRKLLILIIVIILKSLGL
jgi:hypothetical protein